jgi:hypothetical protein
MGRVSMKFVLPDKIHIESTLKEFRKKYFYETDQALGMIFKSYPKNDNISQILAKVAMINQLYRTNIFDPFTVAKHIYNLGPTLDNELLNGSLTVIHEIAQVKFSSKTRHLYSFATKYCSWHYPEKYFIYDSYVEWLLWGYKKEYEFFDYKRSDTDIYEKYHNICLHFKIFFGLIQVSNKTLDEFLWLEAQRIKGWL